MGDPGRSNASGAREVSNHSPTGSPRRRAATNPEEDSPITDHLYFEKQIGVYKVIKKIGKGRYGLVKLGENVQTGAKVAIKIVNKARLNDVEKSAIRTEAEVMTILSHPNVIRLHEVIETSHEICMIMDYAAGGDLFDYLVKRRRLKEKEAHRIFLQICNGVAYCHRHYIVHRDIKAENIFLDEDLNVRIGDWGFSSIFHPGSKIETHCGSLEYAAPEVLSGSAPLSFTVDVWSLGVLLYFLVTGRLPFQGANDFDIYQMIKKAQYKPPKHVSTDCRELIRLLLNPDPALRPTAEQILTSKWCSSVPPSSKQLAQQSGSSSSSSSISPLGLLRGRVKDKLRSISDTKIETSILKVKTADAASKDSPSSSSRRRRKSSSKKRRVAEEVARNNAVAISTITEEEEGPDYDPGSDDWPSSSDTMMTSTDDEYFGSGSGSHSLNTSPISLALASSYRRDRSPERIRVVPAPVSSQPPTPSVSVTPPESNRSPSPSKAAVVTSRSESPTKPRRTKTPPRLVASSLTISSSSSGTESPSDSSLSPDDELAERRKAGPRRQRSDKDMKGAARFSILNLDDKQLQELQKLNQFEVLQVTEKRGGRSSSAVAAVDSATEVTTTTVSKADKKVVVVSSKMPNSRSLLRAFENGKSLMRWNSDTGFRNKIDQHRQEKQQQEKQQAAAQLPPLAPPPVSGNESPRSGSSGKSSKKGITKTSSWSQRQFDESKASTAPVAPAEPVKSSSKSSKESSKESNKDNKEASEASSSSLVAPAIDSKKGPGKKMRRNKPSASFGDIPGARPASIQPQTS